MSGRGRGRGRGRGAAPSGAKLMLMRSAQESGLGDHNLKSLTDITKPALFPEMVWNYQEPESKAVQTSSVYLINKGREIDHRIQTSAHWVRPSQTQVDVVRYHSDKKSHRSKSQMPSDEAVLEQMGKILAADEDYIPADLVPTKKRSLHADLISTTEDGKPNKKPTLEELEERERQRKREEALKANVLVDEEEAEDFSDTPPEEEEEEVEDYTMNYYASDDEESDGGGDAEATF
jgi:hypothetical protein